ncbi:hypothetical protein DFA_12338 [Cavenderia fasciculata]|uniref:Uncharacterized protein n=1 Tax=Cavenderia fasciculata TaxID=261658 RepID=F4QD91_CACFS|nr:uncharacterized protein DFA_12338 [Cavenderia fasciculata]EGG14562.1 hypothetical protein DFA_12338 [Cavenderia fasciculata]|eukprot:XP_004366082.1 hypothetical protein DFA_12338 [Cavenderia fasciculata]
MDSNNNNSTSNNSCSSSSSSIKVQSPLLSTSSSSTNVSAPHVSIAVVDDDTVSAAVSAASVSPPLACTSTTISSPLMSLDMCPCPPPPPPPPLADADSDADADAKVCVATAMVLDPSPCLPSCPLAKDAPSCVVGRYLGSVKRATRTVEASPFASAPYADNRTSQSITTLHLRGSVPGATRSISQLFQANSIPRSVTHLKIKLDVPSPSLRFSFRLTEIFARSNITRISVELVSDAKIKDGKVSTYHIRRDPNTSSKHVFVVEQNSLYGGFIDITNPAITHYLNVKKSGPFISTNSICTTSSSSSSRSTKRK